MIGNIDLLCHIRGPGDGRRHPDGNHALYLAFANHVRPAMIRYIATEYDVDWTEQLGRTLLDYAARGPGFLFVELLGIWPASTPIMSVTNLPGIVLGHPDQWERLMPRLRRVPGMDPLEYLKGTLMRAIRANDKHLVGLAEYIHRLHGLDARFVGDLVTSLSYMHQTEGGCDCAAHRLRRYLAATVGAFMEEPRVAQPMHAAIAWYGSPHQRMIDAHLSIEDLVEQWDHHHGDDSWAAMPALANTRTPIWGVQAPRTDDYMPEPKSTVD